MEDAKAHIGASCRLSKRVIRLIAIRCVQLLNDDRNRHPRNGAADIFYHPDYQADDLITNFGETSWVKQHQNIIYKPYIPPPL
jgi:hypothetical protein